MIGLCWSHGHAASAASMTATRPSPPPTGGGGKGVGPRGMTGVCAELKVLSHRNVILSGGGGRDLGYHRLQTGVDHPVAHPAADGMVTVTEPRSVGAKLRHRICDCCRHPALHSLRSPRLVIEGPHAVGVGCGPCPENTEVCRPGSRRATMVRSEARGKVVPPILVSMSVIRSSCERMRCQRWGHPKSRGGVVGAAAERRSPINRSP